MTVVNHFSGKSRSAGIGGTDANKMPAGSYPLLRLKAAKFNNGHHGLYYIAEFDVLLPATGTGPQPNGQTYEPRPVGASGDWGAKIEGQYAKSGMAECNAMMAALTGETDPVKLEALLGQSCEPGSPGIAGLYCAAEFYLKKTGPGNMMHKAKWSRASPEAIAAYEAGDPVPVSADAPAQSAPAQSAPAQSAPAFPPAGWTVHPQSATHYFKGSEVKTEAELRAMVGA